MIGVIATSNFKEGMRLEKVLKTMISNRFSTFRYKTKFNFEFSKKKLSFHEKNYDTIRGFSLSAVLKIYRSGKI